MKKKTKTILITIAAVVLALFTVYTGVAIYYMGRFFHGTVINGTDYSGKTVKQVENSMAEDIHSYKLKLIERGSVIEEINAEDIDLLYVPDKRIEQLKKKQNSFLWLFSLFTKTDDELSAAISYDRELLQNRLKQLDCFKAEKVKKPVDASFKYQDGSYIIVKEKKGNTLKEDAVYKEAVKAIESGKSALDLEEKDCYEKPKYTQKSKKLIKLVDTLNKYIKVEITYDFGDRSETVESSVIKDWLKIDRNLNITFDKNKVREYVDIISRRYNTFGASRKFLTWDKKEITVKGGYYGWLINRPKETDELIDTVKKGEDVKRTPIYIQKAASRDTNDIGSTYVEINLSEQRMWLFKDGKCIVDTDVVTGNSAKQHDTPPGVYGITYKERDAVLNGEDYSNPVTYWMPFNGNIGIHDASWRTKFGGEIYKTGGSHGCVNTPFEAAKKIFENIEAGTPVICYHHKIDKKDKKD